MDPIILYYGKGQLTGFLADPNAVLDVVPVDVVVNATLAAIAKHGAIGKAGNNIYQIASSVVNPLVIQDLNSFMYHHFKSAPLVDSKGRAIEVSSTVKLFSSMEDLSSHLSGEVARRRSEWVAAMTSSPDEKLFRKFENIWRKSMEQAMHLASIYQPYTFYGGRFDISNTKRLMECLSKEEREEFGFEVENIDWKDYISNVHIPGLRKHVMKGRGMHS
ncbi:Fatty acyl-CoA reductase 2 [Sarracenia purpurea var. burkii]